MRAALAAAANAPWKNPIPNPQKGAQARDLVAFDKLAKQTAVAAE